MYKIISIVTLLLFFNSCFYELDISDQTNENDLAVITYIAGDSLVIVNLIKLIPLDAPANVTYVKDASVVLYENDKKVEELVLDYKLGVNSVYDSIFYYTSKITKAQIGNTYKIVVESANGQLLQCETIIPNPVQILSLDTILNTYLEGIILDRNETFILKFKDPLEELNYYRVFIKYRVGRKNSRNDTIRVFENVFDQFSQTDTIFNYVNSASESNLFGSISNSFYVFNDEDINGEEYEITLKRSYNNSTFYGSKRGEFEQYIVELQSITAETYMYFKSIDLQRSGGQFTEPVPLFTNIKNGVGICAGYSVSQKIITIGEYPMEGFVYK